MAATRSRRRKPTALKAFQGTLDRRHAPQNEPQPTDRSVPQPPAWLDQVALEEWRRVVPELHRMGVLARIDECVVAIYADLFSQWRAAESICRAAAKRNPKNRGLLLETKSRNVIPHPARGVANKLRADMLRVMSEIGLTPSARARLEAVPTDDDDQIGARYFN